MAAESSAAAPASQPQPDPVATTAGDRIVLVSCVKTKLDRPAAAADLYVSAGFRKAREYAEATGAPWFILSAEHGLVRPEEWLSPYERYLPETSRSYRRAWGEWVAARLKLIVGPLDGRTIEIHAGEAYVAAVTEPLSRRGAHIARPLGGQRHGERLAWYGDQPARADQPADEARTAAFAGSGGLLGPATERPDPGDRAP